MPDAHSPYFAPGASNRALDAEPTGRVVTLNGAPVEVDRARVSAPDVVAALDALDVRVSALEVASPIARLLKLEPRHREEVRALDVPGGDRYHGAAQDGAATSLPEWRVVRFYRDAAGTIVRVRYREGVVWDDPSAGW